MQLGRLLVSLLVGAIASGLVFFVFTFIGVGATSPFTMLLAIGVGVAWALFAFVRS
jgi:hypothetical protein